MTKDARIALVTGAGSGIGRVTALAFWQAGYTVVLAGRREGALRETASLAGGIDKLGDRALIVPTDVSDRSAVARLFATIKARFGRLDVLFNNAGKSAPGTPLHEVAAEAWLAVVDVNLNGAFWCLQEAFRLMKAQRPQGGRIINNGSISAQAPRAGSAPYTASKFALTGLTKATALEGRAYDIACGQIDIGNARTDMSNQQQRQIEQSGGSQSVEPQIDARHIADAVLYMANLPLDANVLAMTVMANKMPFVGRG